MQPAVELDRVSKIFRVRRASRGGAAARARDLFRRGTDAVVAVDQLSFSIGPGERVAFIGPNGAGKSTTLKMLAGILRPDEGAVRVLGFEPARERRQLAFQIVTVFGQRSQLWYQLPPRFVHAPRPRLCHRPGAARDAHGAADIALRAGAAARDTGTSSLARRADALRD